MDFGKRVALITLSVSLFTDWGCTGIGPRTLCCSHVA